MKMMRLWLCGLVTVSGLILSGNRTAALADDGDRDMGQRLERLERQMHQLAERQAQLNPGPAASREFRPPGGPQFEAPGRPPSDPQMPQAGPSCRGPGRCLHRLAGAAVFILAVIHIMLAVWVFTDIRKRGEGSGLFIVLALLAGIPGTILYALIRIGDRKTPDKPAVSP